MRTQFLEYAPRVRRGILLAAVAGVPVVFLRGLSQPIDVPKLSLLLVLVAAATALRGAELLQGSDRSGLERLLLPASFVVVPLTIGYLFTPYKGFALLGWYGRFQGLVPYIVLALLGVLLADAFAGRAHELLWAVAGAAGVIGLYAIVQWAGLDPFDWGFADRAAGDVVASTLGNPNFVGGFMAMSIPLTIALWWLTPEKRGVIGLLLAPQVVSTIGAASAGGWVAAVAALGVMGGIVYGERVRLLRFAGLTLAALILLGAVGISVYGARGEDSPVPATYRARGQWWNDAVRMWRQHPVVGRGPNAFAVEGIRYRDRIEAAEQGYNVPDDPHSVMLSFLTAAGIFGALGFLALMAWTVRAGARIRPGDVLGAAFAGAAAAYFVQSFVSVDEMSLRLMLWVALTGMAVAGLPDPDRAARKGPPGKRGKKGTGKGRKGTGKGRKGTGKGRRATGRRPQPAPLRAIPALVLMALLVVGVAWYSVRLLVADSHLWNGETAALAGEIERATSHFDAALSFRDAPEYRLATGDALGSASLRGESLEVPLLQEALQHFRYTDGFPHVGAIVLRARLWTSWGDVSGDPDHYERSVEQYERALRLDAHNPLIRAEAAQVLANLTRTDEAMALLEPALDATRHRRYADVWAALAFVRRAAGDFEGAREAAERALRIDPDHETARRVLEALPG